MSFQDNADLVLSIHDLLQTLGSEGIVLVQLPGRRGNQDVVDAFRKAGERFAKNQEFPEGGDKLLLRYLSDHLYEFVPGGITKVPINMGTITRAVGDPEEIELDPYYKVIPFEAV